MPTNAPLNRKLRMGLVGGGQGAFIGRVHATAAVLDNRAALVAGALSSDSAKAKASAPDYDIPADRAYGSYKEMAEAEKKRSDPIDFVSVATPNHTHFDIAKTFVEAGYNVVCDKPLTFDLAQAEELLKVVEKSGVVFAVSHNYTGHPLVRQAREMVQTRIESSDQKQAKWRTDPKQSGIAGCFGDIGTHAYNLGRYITGLLPKEICCNLKTFEGGRALDDYGTAIIRYDNGALGTVTASQISHGRENDVIIEIDGTKASLEWHQENPNQMYVRKNGEPQKIYTRGGAGLGSAAGSSTRIPPGHPEGYLEAFANIYTAAFDAMAKRAGKEKFETVNTVYPNVYDGVEGMLFITQCVKSSQENGSWLPFRHPKSRK
jgi:predicted dehydrogenase